jgi:hypothetical protein
MAETAPRRTGGQNAGQLFPSIAVYSIGFQLHDLPSPAQLRLACSMLERALYSHENRWRSQNLFPTSVTPKIVRLI